MAPPRIGIGMTLHNNARHLPEALESLRSQTCGDYAIVLLDDASSDETEEIARAFAARDGRASYVRHERRAGMAATWREAFFLARERCRGAMEFFAWASDHDVWDPRWLAHLLEAAMADPDVVLSYPWCRRIDEEGRSLEDAPCEGPAARLDADDPVERFARVCSMTGSAGNMVYGLFRAAALERAGVFRPVPLPDRLLLAELALYGRFREIPEVLWLRRFKKEVTVARQRASLFAPRPPAYAYLPWWLLHGLSLWRALGPRGSGPFGGREALGLALRYAAIGLRRQLLKSGRRRLHRLRKAALALAGRNGPAAATAGPPRSLPPDRRTQARP